METTTTSNGKGKGVRGRRGKEEAPAVEGRPQKLADLGPPSTKAQLIIIPKMQIVQTTIEVEGMPGSELITHKWSEKAKQQMREKQMGLASSGKTFKVAEDDFNGARYLDAEGRDCIPALAFKNACVEAAIACGVFKTTVRKAFFVRGELLPILSEAPRMREDMVRVGQGTADLRYRPAYVNWRCKVPVEYNTRLISLEMLVNLFDNAGYSVGICEWRPEKDGQSGRFRVKLND
jgi:hypothetical protein